MLDFISIGWTESGGGGVCECQVHVPKVKLCVLPACNAATVMPSLTGGLHLQSHEIDAGVVLRYGKLHADAQCRHAQTAKIGISSWNIYGHITYKFTLMYCHQEEPGRDICTSWH